LNFSLRAGSLVDRLFYWFQRFGGRDLSCFEGEEKTSA
jgi:hypothetical protein